MRIAIISFSVSGSEMKGNVDIIMAEFINFIIETYF